MCLSGNVMVRVADGNCVRVDTLRRGVMLFSGALVKTVVRTVNSLSFAHRIPDAPDWYITPWHPMRESNHPDKTSPWFFPARDQQFERASDADAPQTLYSVILEDKNRNKPISLGLGWDVAPLGHSTKGPVIGHAYFGSDKVRDDIDALCASGNGRDGIVTVDAHKTIVHRSRDDGNVTNVEWNCL